MPIKSPFLIIVFILHLIIPAISFADVVKPALVEISVYTDESLKIEIRTSIEGLLTGINSRYKNTKDSPNAQAYDELRVLPAKQLREKFIFFEEQFLALIRIKTDSSPLSLKIEKIDIPLPGYTKVPRTSIITVTGNIPRNSKNLSWYYPEIFGDNAVRVRQIDKENEKWYWSQWQWLRADKASKPFSLTEIFTRIPLTEVISDYIISGFEHIVPKGLDHILFILGIFLFSTRLNPLLWQVTMFTIAHTITLGLSMNGLVSVPAAIVEPLIAISIAYIGFENVFTHTLHRYRLLIVFFFGLLHGLGFASVLAEFGMPENDFITALISFNIGVELGQLTVIAVAYLLLRHWFKDKQNYQKWVIIPFSLSIGLIGLYWAYDRFDFQILKSYLPF
ncbi:MAG: HupE/UreJ family protein [Pseudomonadota bacterium]